MVEGSQILDAHELLSRLTKAHGHELVTVRLAQTIDGTMLNTIASFYQDFFHKPATASTGKDLIIELKKGFLEEHKSLHDLYLQASAYPFLKPIGEVAEKYNKLASMEYRALADTIIEEQEELLMEKLETVDPAVSFFRGSGLQNYDRIQTYLQGD